MVQALLQLQVNNLLWNAPGGISKPYTAAGWAEWSAYVDNYLRNNGSTGPKPTRGQMSYLDSAVETPPVPSDNYSLVVGRPDPATDPPQTGPGWLQYIADYYAADPYTGNPNSYFSQWTGADAADGVVYASKLQQFIDSGVCAPPLLEFTANFFGLAWPGSAYNLWYYIKRYCIETLWPQTPGGSLEISQQIMVDLKAIPGFWQYNTGGMAALSMLTNFCKYGSNGYAEPPPHTSDLNLYMKYLQDQALLLVAQAGCPAGDPAWTTPNSSGLTPVSAMDSIINSRLFDYPNVFYTGNLVTAADSNYPVYQNSYCDRFASAIYTYIGKI
jgi:hypothetical protein